MVRIVLHLSWLLNQVLLKPNGTVKRELTLLHSIAKNLYFHHPFFCTQQHQERPKEMSIIAAAASNIKVCI